MTTGLQSLPPELFYPILDEAADGATSQEKLWLALVAVCWRERALFWLYNCLIIDSVERLTAFLCRENTSRYAVTSLSLWLYCVSTSEGEALRAVVKDLLSMEGVQLRSLELCGAGSVAQQVLEHPNVEGLETLSLTGSPTFFGDTPPFRLNIRKLSIAESGLWHMYPSTLSSLIMTSPPTLRELDLGQLALTSAMSGQVMPPWLVKDNLQSICPFFPTLCRLSLPLIDKKHDLTPWVELLPLATSLVHLELSFTSKAHDDNPKFLHCYITAIPTSLTSLTIHFYDYRSPRTDMSVLGALYWMLEDIALEELKLLQLVGIGDPKLITFVPSVTERDLYALPEECTDFEAILVEKLRAMECQYLRN